MYGIGRLGGLQSEKLLRYRSLLETLGSWGRAKKKTKKKGSERNNKHREPRKEYCERGRVFKHFQVRGHRFSPYGLTESPQITTFGLFTQLCR